MPMSRTELIVGLDYPRWRSLGRLLRRTLMRAVDHRQICNGNTESFGQAFTTASRWLPDMRDRAIFDAPTTG